MMNKKSDILISIRPEWVAKILSGEKTIEVRKTRPTKIETPFKCFIYCTKNAIKYHFTDKYGNAQKVVGEFVCDEIDAYISEFHVATQSNVKFIGDVYEDVCKIYIDDDGEKEFLLETSNECLNPDECALCGNSCLRFDEIRDYIGNGYIYFYGWHISDLKIYDKPKELSEFGLKRPPQSWCYVVELEEY